MSIKAGSNTPNGAQTFNAIYPGTSQKLALTTTSAAASVAMAANTTVVQLVCDSACWIAIGTAPVASSAPNGTTLAAGAYLPANTPTLFACNPGDKVAGISASTGNLYITQGA